MDRGEVSTQTVVLMPVLLLLVFLGFQAAIYFHGANVAAAAAARGAATASLPGAGAEEGVAAAQQTLDDLGSDGVGPPTVTETDGYVSVTVTVDVAQIVPFFPGEVTRTALEAEERFVAEGDR